MRHKTIRDHLERLVINDLPHLWTGPVGRHRYGWGPRILDVGTVLYERSPAIVTIMFGKCLRMLDFQELL